MSVCTFTERKEALKFAKANGKVEVLHLGDNFYIVPLRPMWASMINANGKTIPITSYSDNSRFAFGGIPKRRKAS